MIVSVCEGLRDEAVRVELVRHKVKWKSGSAEVESKVTRRLKGKTKGMSECLNSMSTNSTKEWPAKTTFLTYALPK
ncbi:unnamed protein product [Dovyalis caffra]|uniref:Uncharacterized protein n=1 Tax=Dovyalis caffra TaxID=77055 RepID=A0AAV1SNF8_9ROSI|nr:unnamed protein product [Dovyalis caffra]